MIAAASSETILPLELLQPNEAAQLVGLDGDECQVRRLSEMGLMVGASIEMLRPGSPCVLALDGKRISLRLNNDVDVLVAVQS